MTRFARPPGLSGRRLLAFGVLAVVPIGITVAALRMVAPSAPAAGRLSGSARSPSSGLTAHFLLALAVMLGLALCAGHLASRLRQPEVMGELLVGILLGPSVLGKTGLQDWLFPPNTTMMLHGLAELGLVVFMARVGIDFAGSADAGRPGDWVVAGAALLFPFSCGVALATTFGSHYLGSAGSRAAFVLFLGCALGVTAFPVLARIIDDCALAGTRMAQLSMYSAAIGDGIVWLLLLVAGGYAGARPSTFELWLVLAVLGLLTLTLSQWHRWARLIAGGQRPAEQSTGRWMVTAVVAIAVVSAATAFGGVHEVIGAFVAGLLLARTATGRHRQAVGEVFAVANYVLFPLFLVQFGMSVDLTKLSTSAGTLLLTGVIVLVGSAAKIGCVSVAARFAGLDWRDSLGTGVLTNARGMTELVVLQVGMQLGIMNSTMLAVLTCATILMTLSVAPAITRIHQHVVPGGPPG